MAGYRGISGPRRKYEKAPNDGDDSEDGYSNGNGFGENGYEFHSHMVPSEYDQSTKPNANVDFGEGVDLDYSMVTNKRGTISRSKINAITAACIAIFIIILSLILYTGKQPYKVIDDEIIRPIKPEYDVHKYCAEENISTFEGRVECQNICTPALCCYRKGSLSCYHEFKDICDKYSACEVLMSDKNFHMGNDDNEDGIGDNSSQDEGSNKDSEISIVRTKNTVKPAPTKIKDVCSPSNTMTGTGMLECEALCEGGACCWEKTCDQEYKRECANYEVCKIIASSFSIVEQVIYTCSPSKIGSVSEILSAVEREKNIEACKSLCEPRSCCFDKGPRNCYADNTVWCNEFDPCKGLENTDQDAPPMIQKKTMDIKSDCKKDALLSSGDYTKCEESCMLASCCFSGEECAKKGVNCDDYTVCKPFLDYMEGSIGISDLESKTYYPKKSGPDKEDEIQEVNDDDIAQYLEEQFSETTEETVTPTGEELLNKKGSQGGKDNDGLIDNGETVRPGYEKETKKNPFPPEIASLEPPDDIDSICDVDNIDQPEVHYACLDACSPAICCVGVGDQDCSLSYSFTCRKFNACTQFWEVEGYHVIKVNNGGELHFEDRTQGKKPTLNEYGDPIESGQASPTKQNGKLESHIDETATSTANQPKNVTPPKVTPHQPISWICSEENIRSDQGYNNCVLECNQALCCIGVGIDCSILRLEWCETFNACSKVWSEETANPIGEVTPAVGNQNNFNENNGEKNDKSLIMSPTPVATPKVEKPSPTENVPNVPISWVCSEETVQSKEGHNQCVLQCNVALCCIGVGTDCSTSKAKWCQTFDSCYNVWNIEENTNSNNNEGSEQLEEIIYNQNGDPVEEEYEINENKNNKALNPPPTSFPTATFLNSQAVSKNEASEKPPPNTSPISWVCSDENVAKTEGRNQCVLQCNVALCCIGVGTDCYTSKTEWCDTFDSCSKVWNHGSTENKNNKALNPPPTSFPTATFLTSNPTILPQAVPKNEVVKKPPPNTSANTTPHVPISWVCSDENVAHPEGRNQCVLQCNEALCCIGVGTDCYSTKTEWCDTFDSCSKVWKA